MRWIAHRANLDGPSPAENQPHQIDRAIQLGLDAEIDLRCRDGSLWLGHDCPIYQVSLDWLRDRAASLWIHAKNHDALAWLARQPELHYFWHDSDVYTMTSRGVIWAYLGAPKIPGMICNQPEKSCGLQNTRCDDDYGGICSDYVLKLRTTLEG